MKQEVFCSGCTKEINTIPFIGEKFYKFKDGIYCEQCAKIYIEKKRKEMDKNMKGGKSK